MMSDRARRILVASHIRPRLRTARKAQLERWAEDLGLDVQGTGADGAVTKEDLRAAVGAAVGG